MAIVTSPFPPYQNFEIDSDFYNPDIFDISSISFGLTTTITTSIVHNYTVGQIVRFQIPNRYKTIELDGKEAIITDLPSSTQFKFEIESNGFTPFLSSPYVSTITNITQSPSATVTAANTFRIGDLVKFSGVEGMTEINDEIYSVLSGNPTSFVINANTSAYTAYSGSGTATFYKPYPKAIVKAIGDINSGAINMDNSDQQLYINGSFINVSPQ